MKVFNWRKGEYVERPSDRAEGYWPDHFYIALDRAVKAEERVRELEDCLAKVLDDLEAELAMSGPIPTDDDAIRRVLGRNEDTSPPDSPSSGA